MPYRIASLLYGKSDRLRVIKSTPAAICSVIFLLRAEIFPVPAGDRRDRRTLRRRMFRVAGRRRIHQRSAFGHVAAVRRRVIGFGVRRTGAVRFTIGDRDDVRLDTKNNKKNCVLRFLAKISTGDEKRFKNFL